MDFKVGDTVIRNWAGGKVGKVIRITPKRGDIVVEYNGEYTETYDNRGVQRGDIWQPNFISLYTDEIKQEREKIAIIRRALDLINNNRNNLTVEQAKGIINVFEGESNGEV